MKKSPVGSKILSGYAILFAGILPITIACIAIVKGIAGIPIVLNIILASGIIFFAINVFSGEAKYLKIFAILVMIHYFGISLSNIWHYDVFPKDSSAFKMAIPRIIRGILFAIFYGWYYLLRRKTKEGFES